MTNIRDILKLRHRPQFSELFFFFCVDVFVSHYYGALRTKKQKILNFFFVPPPSESTSVKSKKEISEKGAQSLFFLILFFFFFLACFGPLSFLAFRSFLMDVVEPVDHVEEGEDGGEDHPGPLVDGVDVRQVRDVDFQLRGPSPQAALLLRRVALQGAVAVVVARQGGPPVLQRGAVVGQHAAAARVPEPPGQIPRAHLVLHLHRGQPDVVRVHLQRG